MIYVVDRGIEVEWKKVEREYLYKYWNLIS